MELTQQVVEAWIRSVVKGHFSTRDAWDEIDIGSPEGRTHLRVILGRCIEKKLISKSASNGHYRILDLNKDVMEWETANMKNVLPIILPFGIHKWAKLYPKSIIVVAGEKNSGKSAFLYECIKLNYASFVTELYNSETGPEQMKERFEPLEFPSPAPFTVYERYTNFSDVVEPDNLSIIDYLDYNSEVYHCAEEIDLIFQKLKAGACIIGMQKPPPTPTKQRDGSIKMVSRDLAYGGAFTAKRSHLYITLGQGICKLVHVKNPASKGVNPANKQWSYRFDENGYFTNIKDYTATTPDEYR